jgi:hypothetical protein
MVAKPALVETNTMPMKFHTQRHSATRRSQGSGLLGQSTVKEIGQILYKQITHAILENKANIHIQTMSIVHWQTREALKSSG